MPAPAAIGRVGAFRNDAFETHAAGMLEHGLAGLGEMLAEPQSAIRVGAQQVAQPLLAFGQRDSLDEGLLWLYAARSSGRLGFFGLAAHALLGRLDQARDFVGTALPEVWVDEHHGHPVVAFDGEICNVETPIRYRIRPRALKVIAPRAETP